MTEPEQLRLAYLRLTQATLALYLYEAKTTPPPLPSRELHAILQQITEATAALRLYAARRGVDVFAEHEHEQAQP